MKGILFINGYSGPDNALAEQIRNTGLHIEVVDNMTEDNPFKKYIRSTPALVTITDDMQGEFLNEADVDTVTYLQALLVQSQDKEEITVHKQNNKRLDLMINSEKLKSKQDAEDAMTLEMIEGGLL